MFLGIEIGGTKLQLGVGSGDGPPLAELKRISVNPEDGAAGILAQIERAGPPLVRQHDVTAVGIGFGGPVQADTGRTIVSHQVDGWEDFPLADWCRQTLERPTVIGNDSDLAGLAEARFGAGRGHRIVFYSNVGSGIGGALVIEGELYRSTPGMAAEIGHLRPGLQSDRSDQTVESVASGWGIAAEAQARLTEPISRPLEPLAESLREESDRSSHPETIRQRLIEREEAEEEFAADLLERCDGDVDRLTAAIVGQAATEGNLLAREVFAHACRVYGWAIAQTITLLAPGAVVIGGGVSQVGQALFLGPIRKEVNRYVFPPLRGTFEILPGELDEEVVLHGALAVAAENRLPGSSGQ